MTNPGSGQTLTKYYFAGAARIAMRKYTIPQNMNVEYLLGDHLGSTSLTTDASGGKVSELRYDAWGKVRYSWTASLATTPAYKLSSYTFTGQYSYMDDPTTGSVTEGFGLMFYNARWYDPYLNHFTQPDTIVPNPYNSQDWNRYAYARNNPVKYTDPSGHGVDCGIGMGCVGTPPTPDWIDDANLTNAGRDGYKAYLRVFYYDFNAPYWKDPRLGGDGNLTIEDFVAMNFNEELGLYGGDVADWQEALVRGFNTWKTEMNIRHLENKTSGKAALLNFMSRQTNIGSHRPGPANFDGPWTRLDDALTVVNTQIDPYTMGHADWAVGCVNNEPCQTGSHSPGSRDLPYIKTFIDNQCEPSFSMSGSCGFYENFMFILDADDVNHWSGVVDK